MTAWCLFAFLLHLLLPLKINKNRWASSALQQPIMPETSTAAQVY